MSALDQAFIKAFAKEPSVRTAPRVEKSIAPARAPAEASQFDELYDAGTFYRVDAATERAVPAAHLPEQKVPRRLLRRGGQRIEPAATEPAVEPSPPQPHPQALPPRRNWSRSMLEIARQLAQYDLARPAPDSELSPEIVFTEPPAAEPVVPVSPVPSEQNVAQQDRAQEVEPARVVELPPSPPQAVAELWAIGAVFSQASIVSLADVETWLALPVAPAVTCHENLAKALAAAEPCSDSPAAIEVDAAEEEVPALQAPLPPARHKRKLRIDNAHTHLPTPHAPPSKEAPDVGDDVDTELAPPAFSQELVEEIAEPAATGPVVEQVEVITQPAILASAPVAPEPEPAAESPAPTVPKRPYVPLWEVDHFTWPALCDKLMHDPSGYFASASQKLLSVVRGGLKVLGITGSRRGEGRTTLALCLARAAAQAGIQVALLDADFARPQLAPMLGLETAYGWQEAAIGKIPLSEAAVKSLADRLTVLPLEVSTTSAAGLSLADPRVTATLRATAATFELVIVDLGPLSASEGPLFPEGENCPLDAAIVVRDTRYALVNESRVIGDRLYNAGIEAVGIAENFVTQPELSLL